MYLSNQAVLQVVPRPWNRTSAWGMHKFLEDGFFSEREDKLKPDALSMFFALNMSRVQGHLLTCPGTWRCRYAARSAIIVESRLSEELDCALAVIMIINFLTEYWSGSRRACQTGFDAPEQIVLPKLLQQIKLGELLQQIGLGVPL